jgi:hypothetical protein
MSLNKKLNTRIARKKYRYILCFLQLGRVLLRSQKSQGKQDKNGPTCSDDVPVNWSEKRCSYRVSGDQWSLNINKEPNTSQWKHTQNTCFERWLRNTKGESTHCLFTRLLFVLTIQSHKTMSDVICISLSVQAYNT